MDVGALREALADALSVRAEDVEVAAEGAEPGGRARGREARVVCDYSAVTGHVSWYLDIDLAASPTAPPGLPGPPDARTLGLGVAAALDRVVLYEAELFRPSAYGVATPDGRTGRARLYGPETTGHGLEETGDACLARGTGDARGGTGGARRHGGRDAVRRGDRGRGDRGRGDKGRCAVRSAERGGAEPAGSGSAGGVPGYRIDAMEIPVGRLPDVPVEFVYEQIGDRCGADYAEVLRDIVTALRARCPEGRLAPRGSLAEDTADHYSGFDLRWTVPVERFADCVRGVGEWLDPVHPVLSIRSDPEVRDSADRRLLCFFFRELPLFRSLDLDIRAESPPAGGATVPYGGDWSPAASALADAVLAVKALHRGRPDTARGLVERGFERVGARVMVRGSITGRWAYDLTRLVTAAVRADPDPVVRALADRVRNLIATGLP